jgi:spermidine/putrescine-binding protein
MPRIIKAALIQAASTHDGAEDPKVIRAAMIDKHIRMIEDAAKKGVQVICLQELFYGPYFCAEQETRWYSITEEIPDGPTTQLMMETAKRLGMVIVVPIYEVDGTGIYYNTASVIDADGKYLGKSVNGLTPEDIKVIEAMMIKQKPNIKSFHEDNGQDLLLKGEVDLVLEYNGDIAQIMSDEPDIGFVIPKEGSQLNSDNLCIPKGAPHPKNAHAFINYLLDAEVGKKITETILYPTPNDAAKALMPDAYKNNPVIFPPADVLAKCEYAKFNPELQPKYEEAFTRVRAA